LKIQKALEKGVLKNAQSINVKRYESEELAAVIRGYAREGVGTGEDINEGTGEGDWEEFLADALEMRKLEMRTGRMPGNVKNVFTNEKL